MLKKTLSFIMTILFVSSVNADNIESIFVTPDVFVTSKLNLQKILKVIEEIYCLMATTLKKRKYSIGDMLKDLPGISSTGLGNAHAQ